MRPLWALAVLLACLTSSSVTLAQPAIPPCACPDTVEEVCAGGKKWANSCRAECAGFARFTPAIAGACNGASPVTEGAGKPAGTTSGAPKPAPSGNGAAATKPAAGAGAGGKPCACPRDFKPVCGVDGSTFANKCLAQCVGTKLSDKNPKDGQCGYITSAGQQSKPPANQPAAKPAAQPQNTAARPAAGLLPSRDCACPKDLKFVCGKLAATNQLTTYENGCIAKCLGAQVVYQGSCKDVAAAPGSGAVALPAIPTSGSGAPLPQALQPGPQALQPEVLQPAVPSGPLQQQGPFEGPLVPQPPTGSLLQPLLQPQQPGLCSCSRLKAAVCTVDGVTLRNMCYARCSGAEVAHLGKCKKQKKKGHKLGRYDDDDDDDDDDNDKDFHNDHHSKGCVCPMIYAPVCWGGQTWSNACVARCNGVPGALPC